jgi:hypothetical protein
MKRALLALFSLVAFVAGHPSPGRAADPPAAENQADPFAGPSDTPPGPAPPSDTDEDALLRGPDRPSPPSQSPPPSAPPPPARRAATRPRPRPVGQATDEVRAAAPAAGNDQSGVALELSTSSFASGSLGGGVFVGGRTAGGLILGGIFDYDLLSLSSSAGGTSVSTSQQRFRLGGGLRASFLQSGDRLVDLYGAADVSFEYRSAEVPATSGTAPTANVNAAGFSLAAGPGLRLWVHPQIAVGYVARLRVTYLSGDAGALAATAAADASSASAFAIGFDGTFQILAVF